MERCVFDKIEKGRKGHTHKYVYLRVCDFGCVQYIWSRDSIKWKLQDLQVYDCDVRIIRSVYSPYEKERIITLVSVWH